MRTVLAVWRALAVAVPDGQYSWGKMPHRVALSTTVLLTSMEPHSSISLHTHRDTAIEGEEFTSWLKNPLALAFKATPCRRSNP